MYKGISYEHEYWYRRGYSDGYMEGQRETGKFIIDMISEILLPPTEEAIKECEEASKLVEKLSKKGEA